MKPFVVFLSALLVSIGIASTAQAQDLAQPVEGCSEACTPAELNGDAPKTGDATVKTILYGHFEDILNRAPLNTQFPEGEPNLNRGFLMPTIDTYTGTPGDVHFRNNWFRMFSSAGLVEINEGVWRTHQEPGLAAPIEIKGGNIDLYFYLSANPVPNGNSDTGVGATLNLDVMPQVGVYAKMETGRFTNGGEPIAEGDTGACDTGSLPTCDGRITLISQPGSADVYEIKVPLEVTNPIIPDVWTGADGFIVSINPYQIKGKDSAIQDWQVMQSDWRVRTGPDTPPRIVIEHPKALATEAAGLTIFQGEMFIRWSFLSPWGSYDVDDRTIEVEGEGPTAIPSKDIRLVIIKRSIDHDGHFKPVNATWRLDFQKLGLADGEYKINLKAQNLQHTYELREELTFTIADGLPTNLKVIGSGLEGPSDDPQVQKKDKGLLPGFEAVALLGAVGAALAVVGLRRRD